MYVGGWSVQVVYLLERLLNYRVRMDKVHVSVNTNDRYMYMYMHKY